MGILKELFDPNATPADATTPDGRHVHADVLLPADAVVKLGPAGGEPEKPVPTVPSATPEESKP